MVLHINGAAVKFQE